MRLMPLLRCLAQPFAVLGAWLVVVGTVLPYAPAGDDPLCLAGDTGLPGTHCDACLPVAVLPPCLPAPPPLARPVAPAAPRVVAATLAPRAGGLWIRAPPRA